MAQHDYVIANGTGAAVRSDLNGALAAIATNNSGATEPTTTYAYQWWPDTTTGLLKIRNAANSGWVTVGTLASANLGLLTPAVAASTYQTQAGMSSYAPLASPTFTGTPLVPTAPAGTNTTQIASTAFVFANSITTSGGTLTGNLTVPSLNGGPLAGTRNRIINGDMRIDQRNAGAAITGNDGAFPVDRFTILATQTSKLTVQQSSVAPTGHKFSLLATSSSAYSVAASDQFTIQQRIEGFNTADLGFGAAGASTVTLSFWVRSSLTGTFGGALTNDGYTRSYPFSYTISSANTWEYKSISIAGDTTGTWVGATNGVGARVSFSLGAGSSQVGTANAWTASGALGVTGQTNLVGTNGATFYITGVQLEAGSVATPFERRSYGQELTLCQRYYEVQSYPAFYGWTIASDFQYRSWSAPFAVPKRAPATMSITGANIFLTGISASAQCWTATQASLDSGTGYYITTVVSSSEL